jgi:hypothetical protein
MAGQILAWADAHRERTGRWPSRASGVVAAAPGETWVAIDQALRRGDRGLPGGDSLARLLARRRGHRPGERRPWTPEEDEFVQALQAKEAARRTGRTLGAVYTRRRDLGLPDGRVRRA